MTRSMNDGNRSPAIVKPAVDDGLPEHGVYQLFMLALCVYSIASLAGWRATEETREILLYADLGVSLVFLGDFIYELLRAKPKSQYFFKWGWIDLISSVPLLALGLLPGAGEALKLGRAFRAVRILRALRAIRSGRRLASYLLAHRAESVILATALLMLFLFVFGSIAIFAFEDSADSGIGTAGGAMWWAVSTMFGVDYGLGHPLSVEGKATAAILAASGICLFAVITGLFASWFQAPRRRETEAELKELRGKLEELRLTVPKPVKID